MSKIASNRAIKNTIILYGKMIVSVCIGLFTTRLVVQSLGTVDYGIYALVAGVVATFGFLNSTMSNSSLRFITHSIGKNNNEEILTTFNTTVVVHLLIAMVIVIVIETGGLVMFNYMLNIPADRIVAAKFVFQCMVISTCLVVVTVPYDAIITAHEEFGVLSIIDVSGVVVKLFIAIYLLYNDSDNLMIYGGLMLILQLIMLFCKWSFAKYKYEECKLNLKKYVSKELIWKILSFASWNLFGSLCSIGSTQISAIIINMFFGVRLNAATGIARQANNQLANVSVNMTRALLPQIIKSEGGGDRNKMISLTIISAKYSVFLFSLVALPVLFEVDYLLDLWLAEVPQYTSLFIQLFLITALIEKFTFPLTDAFRAIGKIKKFQVTESILLLLNLPIAYVLYLLFDAPPATIFYTEIIFRLAVSGERLYFAKRLCGLNISTFFRNVIVPAGTPIVAVMPVHFIINSFVLPCVSRLFYSFIVVSLLYSTVFVVWGMTNVERKKLYGFFNTLFEKLLKYIK